MSDESASARSWWDKTKAWAKRNPTLSGAAAGAAAGSIIPGLGTVVGTVGGAVIGHLAGRDRPQGEEPSPAAGTVDNDAPAKDAS
ncbi:MAG: hypothetical protein WBW73_17020 [Rhodoplanes sp.]